MALFPFQQIALFAAWARGPTKRTAEWHGNVWRVGPRARLT